MSKQWIAYVESIAAGIALAAATAALQALDSQSGAILWQPVAAAALVGALGYAQVALRYWQQGPPAPPK